jgi:MFS family permease
VSAATLRRGGRGPFQSLAVPNYRRYFTGQVISISGNWMQTVGEMWLVLRLTDSGAAVGLTAALQFTPMLLAGAWGGVLADRVNKRRLLAITQTLMAIPALTLWALTASGAVEVWMVLALVFVRGAVNAIDNPARQSFVMELVGRDRVVNAVSLNSVIIQSARIIGPAFAGAVIATVGIAECFLLNALSFGAMLIALRLITPDQLHHGERARREPGQVREALRHVRSTPDLLIPLAAMALIGTLSFNFQVLLPLMARFAFHGTAATYAALTTAMAAGAVAGALATGTRRRIEPRLLAAAALAFGALSLAAAVAPTLPLELIVLAGTGAASVTFAAGVNSSLQLAAAPSMRGRVMALYSVVFLGSTPIGAPIAGWLAGAAGPRAGLVLAGVAALVGGVGLRLGLRRRVGAAAGPATGVRTGPSGPMDAAAGGPTQSRPTCSERPKRRPLYLKPAAPAPITRSEAPRSATGARNPDDESALHARNRFSPRASRVFAAHIRGVRRAAWLRADRPS